MKKFVMVWIGCLVTFICCAEDGYRLWLRYDLIQDPQLLQAYRTAIAQISVPGNSPVLSSARQELVNGLEGLLGRKTTSGETASSYVLAGTPASAPAIKNLVTNEKIQQAGEEGFVIITTTLNRKNVIVIAGNSDVGILYGVFHFLRLLQTHQSLQNLSVTSSPKIKVRLLNHWDNLNRSVERGYAGISIWDWHKLPDYLDVRYKDYARANASIGINGAVITNVNANAQFLTKTYLIKIAALSKIFLAYGMKTYLTARFSAPVEIGGLKTADPLDSAVIRWWKEKADEIYNYVPGFGGFLIKANSEGQPGPQNYKRTHADGANMFADAVAPHGGIVMWRAFVYSNETPDDRFKQAYNEFKPLDGRFKKNVLIQVKNGPIDFQPREPFHPLFGSMPKTPLMMEYQLTQEYLGFATHLVYEAPLFKECLDADTYEKGAGSTVAKVIEGALDNLSLSGMAGVANIGNDRNWTGHPFGQANWYSLGRMAWDPALNPATIAEEWLRQTFTNDKKFIDTIKQLMLTSRETVVNYMTPLGLHHIMGYGHHYGPAPWYNQAQRADWNPVYFHKADTAGLGFDRTAAGSNALAQYAPQVAARFANVNTCPEEYLLWFHHVSWNHKMISGRSLWDELCFKYYAGVDAVRHMQASWNSQQRYVDAERFNQVRMLLAIQEKEAVWWRNSCLLYFQTFSKMPIPEKYEQPDKTLEYYESLKFPFAPGNG